MKIKNKKLLDKTKIHKVWREDECGPIVTQVQIISIPHPKKFNGDLVVQYTFCGMEIVD